MPKVLDVLYYDGEPEAHKPAALLVEGPEGPEGKPRMLYDLSDEIRKPEKPRFFSPTSPANGIRPEPSHGMA